MVTAVDFDLAYDWIKRCGSIASKLSADVEYLGAGLAPESAWTASDGDVSDVADKIADQLDRAPTILELARGHVETCHNALVELNRNNVAGYRAGGELYLHAHGAILGITSTLCRVVRGWAETVEGWVEVPLRGDPTPPVERLLLRDNLSECAKSFVTDEMWVSHDEIQELLIHAEREHILAKAAAPVESRPVSGQLDGKKFAIPAEFRTKPLSKKEAAAMRGYKGRNAPQAIDRSGIACIKDGGLFIFDCRDFNMANWPKIVTPAALDSLRARGMYTSS